MAHARRSRDALAAEPDRIARINRIDKAWQAGERTPEIEAVLTHPVGDDGVNLIVTKF